MKKPMWSCITGLTLLLTASSAFSQPPISQQQLTVVPARIATAFGVVNIEVELARTEAQRRRGLMGRTALASNAGMLFIYRSERAADSGFWMFQTLIPLDIAYLSAEGDIRAIRTMAPCPPKERCPAYPAGHPFSAALEMSQGFFGRHHITVGDRVEWDY